MIGSRGITEPEPRLDGAKHKTVAWTEDGMLSDGPVRRSVPGKSVDVELYSQKRHRLDASDNLLLTRL